jgi:hypothetical protein
MIKVNLSAREVAVLDCQLPSSRTKGGWQNLLVTLQERVNRSDRSLVLDISDIEGIRRYAFSYGNGGWEDRLRSIFSRSLGPELGHQFLGGDKAA